MSKFEELLAKYNKTAEDITFEYKNLSDEELEKKFAELFEQKSDAPEEPIIPNTTVECSYTVNGEVRKFAVSLQEKIYAISDLVNATYAEQDNTYYGVSVYDTYVIMCDWWTGKYFKQTYTDKDNVYYLTGDRIEVYAEFVTADEQKELESMRSNYASLIEFKETVEKNELHAKRETVLADENYSVLAAKNEEGNYINASYAKLYAEMDNYSVEDLEKEMKILLADYALNGGKLEFSAQPDKPKKGILVGFSQNTTSENSFLDGLLKL